MAAFARLAPVANIPHREHGGPRTDLDDIKRDLAAAREALIRSLDGVTLAEIVRRPPGEITDDEQRWPINDVIWHVGAQEDTFRRQIDQGLAQRPITTAPNAKRPTHMTTAPLLVEWLVQSRRPTDALLRRMTVADLDREFTMPNGATRTPRQRLATMIQHDRDHADQVRALRALPAEA